jgi:hypothetical protein
LDQSSLTHNCNGQPTYCQVYVGEELVTFS